MMIEIENDSDTIDDCVLIGGGVEEGEATLSFSNGNKTFLDLNKLKLINSKQNEPLELAMSFYLPR